LENDTTELGELCLFSGGQVELDSLENIVFRMKIGSVVGTPHKRSTRDVTETF
jgi:hypothetical protein